VRSLGTCRSHPLLAPFDFRNIATARSVGVAAIVVLPAGTRDPERAFQPSKTTPAGGVHCATFPLSVLSEDNDVRLVYEGEVCCGDVAATECAVPFKLKGVK